MWEEFRAEQVSVCTYATQLFTFNNLGWGGQDGIEKR